MPGRDLTHRPPNEALGGWAFWIVLYTLLRWVWCRADEVREKFERFGEIRDVYLPRDYYTGYDIYLSSVQSVLHKSVRWPRSFGVGKQEQD